MRLKEKSENLDAEVRQLKTKLEEKESYIDQIHKQLARSNTVIEISGGSFYFFKLNRSFQLNFLKSLHQHLRTRNKSFHTIPKKKKMWILLKRFFLIKRKGIVLRTCLTSQIYK